MRRAPRFPTALAALLTALVAAGTPARAQVVVGAQGSSVQVAPGGQVTVPVVVDMTGSGGFSLGSLAAQLSWTPATLRYVGATGGSFGAPTLNPDSATGTLRFAVANPAGATGQVVVLNVTFDATGASGDTTYLNVAVSQLTSAVSFTDLTPVTTSSLVCVGTAAGIWGDVDNNGSITSFDALLIVTHAVGLSIAPNSPALGDVDADGQVTTRDALIVLTHVVSLPTPGFRPGQPVAGTCGGPPPVAVTAAPTSLALVIGDTVPVSAVATDSLGQIASVPGFAWTSLDTTIARVSPAGRVAAVGVGVTGAVVAVAPGVMDTVGLTVVTTRTLWYVDAAAAAQNQSETGSPAYPFGTLQQAVNRAAPGDTVYVRGGTYGVGGRSVKPLAIIGAPGYPVPRFGGPIVFDSIASGSVILGRLVVADAGLGVQVRGAVGAAAVLARLDSVGVERSAGWGVELAGLDSVFLRDVAVLGAVDKGLAATDVRALALHRVAVDGVNATISGQGTGRTVSVLRAQSFAADSSSFRLGTVVLDTVLALTLHHVQVSESFGPLLQLTGANSAILDTVVLRRSGASGFTGYVATLKMVPGGTVIGRETAIFEIDADALYIEGAATADFDGLRAEAGGQGVAGAAADFLGVGRVTIRRGVFADGRVYLADVFGMPDTKVMRLDTVSLQRGSLVTQTMDTLAVRGASVAGGGGYLALVRADSVRVVSLVGVEVSGQTSGSPAVHVSLADSVRADSLYLHDNYGSGLYVDASRTVVATGGRYERNSAGYAYDGATQFVNVPAVRIAQSVFEQVNQANSVEWYPGALPSPVLTVDTVLFRGSGSAVNTYGTVAARVTLRGASLARGPGGYGRQLLYMYQPGRAEVLGSRVDSTDYYDYAISAYTDTVVVQNTQMDFVGSGIYLDDYSGGGVQATIAGSSIACRPGGGGSYYGVQAYDANATIAGNTITGCWRGIQLYTSATRSATVTGNSVTALDPVNGEFGIMLYGSNWRQSVVSNNLVSGGRMNAGIYLEAGASIDTLRVDSNTVEDGFGRGIYMYGQFTGTRLYRNTIQRMRPYYPSDAAIYTEYAYGADTLRVRDNRLLQNRARGMYLANGSGGTWVQLDSNVVVDDSLTAVYVDLGTKVFGRANFIARNRDGIYGYGTITIDSSVIQQHTRAGAEHVPGGTLTLADNWWGDPSGPRCDTGCVGALGDSIIGAASVFYTPFLTAAPSTPTGAPPAMRPAAPAGTRTTLTWPRAVEPAWFTPQRRVLPARRGGDR